MRYCRCREDAEEVLQEGFIKIFGKLKHFENSGSFEAWMRKIMVNTALTQLRLSKKYTFEYNINEMPDLFIADTNPLSKMEAKEILSIINKLPEPYKTVLNMFSIDGYSHQEIAQELGISEASSRVALHRAKALLIKHSGKPVAQKRKVEYGG